MSMPGWNASALLSCYKRLRETQDRVGYILNNDLIASLREYSTMSEESLHRHATTVLDSTLRPVIDMKDLSSVTFKIVSHVYTPIDFFTNFLKHVAAAPNPNTSDNEALQKLVFPETVHQPRRETPVQPVRTAVVSPPVPPGLSAFEEEKQTPFIVANFEAADPISKFLAMLRKNGMDILFPITCQDAVLAAIFVAVRAPDSHPHAHRDLIDCCIHAKTIFADKNCGESISKTKVRGVLALLKHAEVLVAQTLAEGQPVQLSLSHSIKCFDDLRSRLDGFLLAFSTQFELKIPVDMWIQLIWRNQDHKRRLSQVLALILRLQPVHERYLREIKTESDPKSPDLASPGISAQTTRDWEETPTVSRSTTRDDWEETPAVSRSASLDYPLSTQIVSLQLPEERPDFLAQNFTSWLQPRGWYPWNSIPPLLPARVEEKQLSLFSGEDTGSERNLEESIEAAADFYIISQHIKALSPSSFTPRDPREDFAQAVVKSILEDG